MFGIMIKIPRYASIDRGPPASAGHSGNPMAGSTPSSLSFVMVRGPRIGSRLVVLRDNQECCATTLKVHIRCKPSQLVY